MSEKIKELVRQSVSGTSPNWLSLEDAQKLSELIVQECASKVDWILAEGGKTQGDLIKEHFGVEE